MKTNSPDNFAIEAEKLIRAFDALIESNGASSLAWSRDYTPGDWVRVRIGQRIESLREMVAARSDGGA